MQMPSIDLWAFGKDLWRLAKGHPAVAALVLLVGLGAWGGYQYGRRVGARDQASETASIEQATTRSMEAGIRAGFRMELLYEIAGYRHEMSNPECPPSGRLVELLSRVPVAFADHPGVIEALEKIAMGADVGVASRELLEQMAEAEGLEPAPLSVPIAEVADENCFRWRWRQQR